MVETGGAANGGAQFTGIIKWFDRKKGFGFLAPETGGDDIFIHQLNIGDNSEGKRPFLDEGDTIYYDMGEHNGRPTAINVKLPAGKGLGADKRRRPRGRNAKKEADAEAEAEATQKDAAAAGEADKRINGESAKDIDKPSAQGEKNTREGGGRDGGKRRNEYSQNRPKRNDKGVAGKGGGKGGSRAQGPKGVAAATDPVVSVAETTES